MPYLFLIFPDEIFANLCCDIGYLWFLKLFERQLMVFKMQTHFFEMKHK